MKCIPGLLNEHGLFQRTGALLSGKGANEMFSVRIEHFLYRATCILISLKHLQATEKQTVMFVRSYINQLDFGADQKIALSSGPMFHVYSQIPSYFALHVNMQNDLLLIIQKVFDVKRDVPSSPTRRVKKALIATDFQKVSLKK